MAGNFYIQSAIMSNGAVKTGLLRAACYYKQTFPLLKGSAYEQEKEKKGWNTQSNYVKWWYILKVLKCTYWNHHFQVKRKNALLDSWSWVKPLWQLQLILGIKLPSATIEIQVFFIPAGEKPSHFHLLHFHKHAALFCFLSGFKTHERTVSSAGVINVFLNHSFCIIQSELVGNCHLHFMSECSKIAALQKSF